MARFNAPDVGFPNNVSYVTDAKGYPVGATSVGLIKGYGAIEAGDAVTFGAGPVYSAAGSLSGPGSLSLAPPGLIVALAPAELPVTAVSANPEKIAASSRAAAIYNSLTTEAAQVYLLGKDESQAFAAGLAAQHGVAFHQWYNSIAGLKKPEDYSGPAGTTEIAAVDAALKAAAEPAPKKKAA